jgi:hypothetical protein
VVRVMVGLLAAVGAVTSGIVGAVHGDLMWLMLAVAGLAAGLVAYVGAVKKSLRCLRGTGSTLLSVIHDDSHGLMREFALLSRRPAATTSLPPSS